MDKFAHLFQEDSTIDAKPKIKLKIKLKPKIIKVFDPSKEIFRSRKVGSKYIRKFNKVHPSSLSDLNDDDDNFDDDEKLVDFKVLDKPISAENTYIKNYEESKSDIDDSFKTAEAGPVSDLNNLNQATMSEFKKSGIMSSITEGKFLKIILNLFLNILILNFNNQKKDPKMQLLSF